MENISLHPDKRFSKVIFWGHPLHSHTHSYIYAGFKKAFEYLGYKTLWYNGNIDNTPFYSPIFDNALIFATGDQAEGLPMNKSSYYVFHNVDAHRYHEYGCKMLFLQTRPQNPNILTQNKNVPYEYFNPYTLLLKIPDVNCLYMNWATDLLPHEHETDIKNDFDKPYFIWVGTYGDSTGEFQTDTNLMPYVNECKKNGIETRMINCWSTPISFEENHRLVRGAFLAPAIQGVWQVNNGYIPCRIFKNISYGNIGITNNPYVNELFENMLVYNNDPVQLFYKSVAARDSFYHEPQKHKYLMNEVRTKHTYLNRIEYILKCLPE